MKKKLLLLFVFCVFVLLIGNVAMAEPIVLRYAETAPVGTTDYEGGVLFCKLVEERTDGNVKVEFYPSGQLGSDKAITSSVISGAIDIAKCSAGNFSDFSNALYFCDLPGLFSSHEHIVRVFLSPIREEVFNRIKEDTGLHVLMFDIDAGAPRAIGNSKRPVHVPDDTKGLKMRSTGSPPETALFKSWGVDAIAVDWSELYVALQQGLVDAYYVQPENSYFYSKLYEVAGYYTITNQSWVVSIKVMGPSGVKKLGGVDSEYYNIVKRTAREVELYKRLLCSKVDTAAKKGFEEAGIDIYYPNEKEMELWNQKSMSIWDQFVGPDKVVSADLIKRIQDLAD